MEENAKLRDYLTRVTAELHTTRSRLRTEESRTTQPVAVTGLSCRFPGGSDTPDTFWQNLLDGRDAVAEVPARRWDIDPDYDPRRGVPGKSYTRHAALVDGMADWDARFFGYTAQEAVRLDPQHRLALELVWEAMEDSGLPAEELRGSRTGIFLGMGDSGQYVEREHESDGDFCMDDPNYQLGISASAAAGRIAYHLDLRGPCVSVDTACSSALAAVHMAVQSLRRGECDIAFAGATSAVSSPKALVQACLMNMLAADGRTKTFDESADGYVLGEGGGFVVLQRASDAGERDRPVRALIRGIATNQDGRTNGLTAPNRHAQRAVIRSALADADVTPQQIGFVEAHGTGTALGDTIEIGALGEVFGERGDADPLLVGAVKTYVGHLTTASGIIGLIKSVLALEHGEIPTNLHLERPNPAVDLDGAVRPVQHRQAFPALAEQPRRAGVSSFGWSGTNVHAVVEQAPHRDPDAAAGSAPGGAEQVITLSAADRPGLAAAAGALASFLEAGSADLADVAFTTQTGRTALPVRAGVVCADVAEAVAALRQPIEAAPVPSDRQRVGLLLPAQPPSVGTVRELHVGEPVFRAALDECAELITARFDRTVDLLAEPAGAAARELVCFAAQYGLVRLLAAHGLVPEAVEGHGAGRYVAAHTAGVLGLADALALAAGVERTVGSDALRPPTMILVSDGAVLPAAQAADPDHWARSEARPGVSGGLAEVCTAVLVAGDRPSGEAAGTIGLLPAADGRARPAWLGALARCWELGLPVRWAAGHRSSRSLVRLPTYPFQRTRYWPAVTPAPASPAAPAVVATGGTGTRFLAPGWVRRPAAPADREPGPLLVLAPDGPLGAALAETDGAVVAHPGTTYRPVTDGRAVVDPSQPEHLEQLLTAVAGDGTLRVVHALGRSTGADAASVDDALRTGCFSLVQLVQAIGRALPNQDVELVVALADTYDVIGGDAADPLPAVLLGLCRSIGVEYPRIRCHCVDLDSAAPAGESAAALLAEFGQPAAAGSGATLSARRRGRRWEQQLEPVQLPAVADDEVWRPGGMYVITGGNGGLGLAVAHRLAPLGTKLALLSRSEVPEDTRRELENAGAEVMTVAVDVSDRDGVAAALDAVRERFVRIDGVVHAAGVPGGGLLQNGTLEQFTAVLAPKVHGTLALAAALREDPPELLVLFSSMVTAVGGHGESEYGAANAFLDAFAGVADGAGTVADRVVSIGWGLWQHDSWQSATYADAPELLERVQQIRAAHGFGSAQGVAALESAAAAGPAHVYALNQPLEDIVAALRGLSDPGAAAVGVPVVAPEHRLPRPELRIAYLAPRTPTERRIAEVWEELLGIEQVGVNDPFFELGGTSLVGLAMVSRISAEQDVELAAATVFEHPTVARLAQLLDGATGAVDATPRDDSPADADDRGRRRRARGSATATRRRRGAA